MNCKNKSFMTKKKAFTLIELLIVIAIIGILFIVLVSKVDFATDKAKATGVQTDFRSFQMAFDTVARENAGFNTFGWDTGDANANGKRDSYDEGDTNKDSKQDTGEVWTGHKVYAETFTKVYSLVKPGTTGYDRDALNRLETAINANLDPKLHITIKDDGEIVMANGAQDPWNKEYHGYYITNAEVDGKDRGAIIMYSDGADSVCGSEHTISGGIVTISIPGNNKFGKDDYSIVSLYTYVNGYGEVLNMSTGFSNNQSFVGQGNISDDLLNDDNNASESLPEMQLDAGLYDANNVQLASWDELVNVYGLDITKTYTETTYVTNSNSLYGIINNNSNLLSGTKLVVGDNITSIGRYALAGCINLTDITISDTVTNIEQNALNGCNSLIKLTVPFVGQTPTSTNNQAILGYWFGASSYVDNLSVVPETLKTVVITNATNLSTTFYGCQNLTNIVLNDGLIEIGGSVFRDCTGLTKIDIPATVQKIQHYAFSGCINLSEINMPSSVKYIGAYVFYNCEKLTRIEIPSGITELNMCVFSGCVALTDIIFPEGLQIIGQAAFSNCVGLTDIIIPSTVTTINSIAFYECTGLTEINMPSIVTKIGDSAFAGCTNIQTVRITDLDAWLSITFGSSTSNPMYYANELLLNGQPITGEVVMPETATKVPYYALKNTQITGVTLHDNITTMQDGAFYGCAGLNAIEIPSTVTTFGSYVFSGCIGFTELKIPNDATKIGKNAFYGCSNLMSLTVPFIGYNATTTSGEWYLGYWFNGTHSNNDAEIPESLKTVVVTNAIDIDSCAFEGCSCITTIILNEGITQIGGSAFNNCTSLTDINIPSTVTSLGGYAFRGCISLTNITIPGSITRIGDNAFYECSNLTTITYTGIINEWKVVSKGNSWNSNIPARYIICSDGQTYL